MKLMDMLFSKAIFGGGAENTGGTAGGGGKTAYYLNADNTRESWIAKYPAGPISDMLGDYYVQLSTEPASAEELDKTLYIVSPIEHFPNVLEMHGRWITAADGEIIIDAESGITAAGVNGYIILLSVPNDNPMGIPPGVYLNLEGTAFSTSGTGPTAYRHVLVAWGL